MNVYKYISVRLGWGKLFKVFKSTLTEYEIFKIEKNITAMGRSNRKHYTQVLNLLEKESKEKKRHVRLVSVYSVKLLTKRYNWYTDISSCRIKAL